MDAILSAYQDRAADTFADARQVALTLQADQHPVRRLALAVALALADMAHLAHDAAEMAAGLEGEGATWR